MARNRGTDSAGRPFPEAVVDAVWSKGRAIPGNNPAIWRTDICGSPIVRFDHGDTHSPNGWEIDHIIPVAKGGKDDLANLQPLQWDTNRRKGDQYPWTC